MRVALALHISVSPLLSIPGGMIRRKQGYACIAHCMSAMPIDIFCWQLRFRLANSKRNSRPFCRISLRFQTWREGISLRLRFESDFMTLVHLSSLHIAPCNHRCRLVLSLGFDTSMRIIDVRTREVPFEWGCRIDQHSETCRSVSEVCHCCDCLGAKPELVR